MTQAFNLSQLANKVNTSGQLDVSTGSTGTLAVTNGGTGASSLTGNGVAVLNSGGTALTSVAAGTSGNVLTSDGTTWTSQAATGGQFKTQLFTSPGTWTKPASCTQVKVTVVGGGGGRWAPPSPTSGINPGGTSSFGSLVSATGGTAAPTATATAQGTGSVSAGITLRTYSPSWGPATSTNSLGGGNGNGILGILSGAINGTPGSPSQTVATFSASGQYQAGSTPGTAGYGGIAVAIVPVTADVPITVGAGGLGPTSPSPALSTAGVAGAILVEFIG